MFQITSSVHLWSVTALLHSFIHWRYSASYCCQAGGALKLNKCQHRCGTTGEYLNNRTERVQLNLCNTMEAAALIFDWENRMLNKSGRRKTEAAGMERKLSWLQGNVDNTAEPLRQLGSTMVGLQDAGLLAAVCTALI